MTLAFTFLIAIGFVMLFTELSAPLPVRHDFHPSMPPLLAQGSLDDSLEDNWDRLDRDGQEASSVRKKQNRRKCCGGGKKPSRGPVVILILLSVITVLAAVLVFILIRNSRKAAFENYYEPVSEATVQKESDVEYVANQLIIIAKTGTSKNEVERLLHSYGMTVVGYVELMDTYQVRLPGKYSLDELSDIAESLQNDTRIECAEVDVVWIPQAGNYRGDPWNEFGSPSRWDDGIAGNNWGVKAINAPYCWDNYDLDPIKIGVIDTMFDPGHEDVRFASLANNTVFKTYKNEKNSHNREHGTHVSGIIGAAHNKVGISGVVENCHLYGFSKIGYTGVMDDLSAIAGFSASGVRVINYSYGYKEEIFNDMVWKDLPLTSSRAAYKKYYVRAGKEMETALEKLLNRNYDFLLVVSAGNQPFCNMPFTTMDAKWGSVFTYLSKPEIKDRIIVVGAAENDGGHFSIAPYSLRGERLDVMAPGSDIYSAIPADIGGKHYDKMSGTSQAAPHVTGVCASVWAANPSLSGKDIKKIIVETADIPVSGGCPNMVNMRAALESVQPIRGSAPAAAQNQAMPALTPSPSSQDDSSLFDERRWTFFFGQTLGSTFDAVFHKDGTFSAASYGSGIYDDGTYTYHNGILTIDFWFTGSGCKFAGDADGFTSFRKYEMQIDEDYYTIKPAEGKSSVY